MTFFVFAKVGKGRLSSTMKMKDFELKKTCSNLFGYFHK